LFRQARDGIVYTSIPSEPNRASITDLKSAHGDRHVRFLVSNSSGLLKERSVYFMPISKPVWEFEYAFFSWCNLAELRARSSLTPIKMPAKYSY
jgi:hypothetical protein